MPKVSVIIPVYGVEKYIERCARSLFEQTLDDIEFIFVDDCSPDRSIEILRSIIEEYRLRFAEKKYTIRIERMPTNSGLPAVRRHGVKLATGDYIIHCDSDDWVEKNAYELLYEIALKNNADVVWCDFYFVTGSSTTIRVQKTEENNMSHIHCFLNNKIMASTWNSLVKNSLYDNDIIFSKTNMLEDIVLMTQIYYRSTRIKYVNRPLYYYRFNPNSICNAVSEEKVLYKFHSAVSNTDFIHDYLKARSFQDVDKSSMRGKMMVKNLLLPLVGNVKYQKLWLSTYQEINRPILLGKIVEPKIIIEMIIFSLYRFIPNCVFRKIAKYFSC